MSHDHADHEPHRPDCPRPLTLYPLPASWRCVCKAGLLGQNASSEMGVIFTFCERTGKASHECEETGERTFFLVDETPLQSKVRWLRLMIARLAEEAGLTEEGIHSPDVLASGAYSSHFGKKGRKEV